MPDQKISELTELISANATSDVVPIVDIDVNETKKVTFANLPITESQINHAYPHTVDFDGGVAQTRNLTSLNSSQFSSSVDSVYVGNDVTSIGSDTFKDNGNLISVTISDSTASIGSKAFSYCTGLTSLAIGSSVTTIGSQSFEYCSSLTSVTIPESASIGNYAFMGCTGLKNISFGGSVTEIGSVAFYGCHSLSGVTLPDGLTSIKNGTFSYCGSLTTITIPSGVTSIGNEAFQDCTSLSTINLLATTPPEIGESVFLNCAPGAELHVPVNSTYSDILSFGGFQVIKDL